MLLYTYQTKQCHNPKTINVHDSVSSIIFQFLVYMLFSSLIISFLLCGLMLKWAVFSSLLYKEFDKGIFIIKERQIFNNFCYNLSYLLLVHLEPSFIIVILCLERM
jgi:hypothetical protein